MSTATPTSTATLNPTDPAVTPAEAPVAEPAPSVGRGPIPETDFGPDSATPDVAGAGSEVVCGGAVNEVRLVGRLSALSEPHVLPSGDSVVTLRLVVGRGVRRPRQPSVDTIDVACWTPDTQRDAAAVGVDGRAEVVGSLRRRFFRGPGGPQSRYEVEARSVRSLADDQSSDPGGR